MKSKVGLITIGQSPRVDITPDLLAIWKDQIEVIEKGALDDLSDEEIKELRPNSYETLLVSRLRDGRSVELSEERIIPLLQQKIYSLENQVQSILLMCTGEFSDLHARVPLIQPDAILRNTVKGILKVGQTLGVLVPEKQQIKDMQKIWNKYVNNDIVFECGSPYGSLDLIHNGAQRLKEKAADLIVLDCMGYSIAMKNEVRSTIQKPIVLPRTLIARIMNELI